MLGEELRRLITWSERHRRLLARVLIAFCLSVVVDAVCATLMWSYESGLKGSSIHGFGDAVFFSTAQIVTVSSSYKNPVTQRGPDRRRRHRGLGDLRRHRDRRLVRLVVFMSGDAVLGICARKRVFF